MPISLPRVAYTGRRLSAHRSSRLLLGAAGLSAASLVLAIVGLIVADNHITGAPAWLKPAKFGVSITIYTVTLAWLFSLVEGHRRLVWTVAGVSAIALIAELVLIDVQVLRGTTSHFNDDTGFDSAVFSTMGALIGAVFLAAIVTAVLVLRQKTLTGPLATGIRAGVWISLLGMAEAGLMLVNSTWHSGGGHTVGAPDGGPGLPVLGWSTEYGDLRVAHFVGLHALQVLPLIALAVRHRAPPASQRDLVRLAALVYAGLVVVLAWQAERQLPLFEPDRVIGVAVGAGLVAALLAALAITRTRREPAS